MASNVIKWFNIVTCRGRVGLSYIGDIILLIFVLKNGWSISSSQIHLQKQQGFEHAMLGLLSKWAWLDNEPLLLPAHTHTHTQWLVWQSSLGPRAAWLVCTWGREETKAVREWNTSTVASRRSCVCVHCGCKRTIKCMVTLSAAVQTKPIENISTQYQPITTTTDNIITINRSLPTREGKLSYFTVQQIANTFNSQDVCWQTIETTTTNSTTDTFKTTPQH